MADLPSTVPPWARTVALGVVITAPVILAYADVKTDVTINRRAVEQENMGYNLLMQATNGRLDRLETKVDEGTRRLEEKIDELRREISAR